MGEEEGSPKAAGGESRVGRIAVFATVLPLVVGGLLALLLAIGVFSDSAEPSPPPATPRGFHVLFPAGPRGWDANGRAILDPSTNLPEGTLVDLYYFSADLESPGQGTVENGRIEVRASNSGCHQTDRGLVGTDVRVDVTVLPEYPYGGSLPMGFRGSPPAPMTQPPNVQALLGANFQRLVGDQVSVRNGQRQLEIHHAYELPADRCSGKLEYTGGGSFRVVRVTKPLTVPTGPFPRPPFSWCPDTSAALPTEASESSPDEVALRFDVALSTHDTGKLRSLADRSVRSLTEGWHPIGSPHAEVVTNIPSGEYMPQVVQGCGAMVAIRTWGAQLATNPNRPSDSLTYLLVLRRDGWKVWGWLPGDGR